MINWREEALVGVLELVKRIDTERMERKRKRKRQ